MYVTFEDWTKRRVVPSIGTNAGADELPFQNWRHVKEAFAPELIARAIAHSKLSVKRCCIWMSPAAKSRSPAS